MQSLPEGIGREQESTCDAIGYLLLFLPSPSPVHNHTKDQASAVNDNDWKSDAE